MYYDKASNEVKVKEKEEKVKKKLIKNANDLEKEKQALYKEIGLDEQGFGKDSENTEVLAEKYRKLNETIQN